MCSEWSWTEWAESLGDNGQEKRRYVNLTSEFIKDLAEMGSASVKVEAGPEHADQYTGAHRQIRIQEQYRGASVGGKKRRGH